jgi:hypothetical protein
MERLNDLKESENGVFEGYSENHNWTHKSFLWELPYAKNIDTILQHQFDAPRMTRCRKHHEHVS